MRVERPWALFAPLVACGLLAGWIALSAANIQAATFSVLMYVLANLIVYTDAFDFAIRLYAHRRHIAVARAAGARGDGGLDLSIDLALPAGPHDRVSVRPYAIVASVFNLEDRLDEFIEAYRPYRDRMWIISDGSTDRTETRLRQAGWRCFDDGVNRHKPGALRRLLENLPAHIETVMVIDPDVRIRSRGHEEENGSSADLEQVIGEFQRSGAAALCPRIMIEPDGFLARFQAFEYALAFRIGRRSLADYAITSGTSIYRRDALVRMLAEHSLSVYAEDLENAVILLSHGERIYYDGRLVVSTEGPGAWRRWFSQRVGWYYGLLKVYTERFPAIRRVSRTAPFALYHYIIYMGVLSLVLHVIKIASATLLLISLASGFDTLFVIDWLPANPAYFVAAVGSYVTLGAIALFTIVPKAERGYAGPIVPLYLFYALMHIAPMTVGFGNWIALKLWGRRLYRDHYEARQGRETSPAGAPLQAWRVR